MSISVGHERLRTLYSILAGVPDGRLDLKFWRAVGGYPDAAVDIVHDCKTVGCAVGWATAFPDFQAQGFTMGNMSPRLRVSDEDVLHNWDAIEQFFDLDSEEARLLFVHRDFNKSHRDPLAIRGSMNCADENGLTDHQAVLRRIRRYLTAKGVIAADRNAELAEQEGVLQ